VTVLFGVGGDEAEVYCLFLEEKLVWFMVSVERSAYIIIDEQQCGF
jgi:hypothetical protein